MVQTNVQADQELLDKWVLSYSISQDAFHVEELKYYLKTNLELSLRKVQPPHGDYKMIGLYDNQVDAHNFSEYLCKNRDIGK